MRMLRPAVSAFITLLGGLLLGVGFIVHYATIYMQKVDPQYAALEEFFSQAGIILAMVGILSHMLFTAMNK